MTIGVLQEQYGSGTGASMSASWASPTTVGSLLLAIVTMNNTRDVKSKPSGWQLLASYQDDELAETWLVYEIPDAASRSGAENFESNLTNNWRLALIELSSVDGEAYIEAVEKFATPTTFIAHEPQRRGIGYALFAQYSSGSVGGFDAAASTGSWTVVYSSSGVLVRADAVPGQLLEARVVDGTSSWRGVYLGIAEQHTDIRPTARKADVQTFTASGTWNKPDGAREVNVICIGGGGGAGSGRRGAAGTVRQGGAGGGGAGYSQAVLDPDDLASSVAITIGAGGAGGAAVTTDNTDGNAGSAGGTTTFGSYLSAVGGNGGAQGSSSGTPAGGAATTGPQTDPGSAGGSSGSSGGAGNSGSNSTQSRGPTGGASGGGHTTANSNSAGAVGGTHNVYGATPGGASGGGDGPTVAGIVGLGGGGSAGLATDSLPGGNGGLYGGGGGGGGAGIDATANSGKGGNGGDGVVIVTTIF